jgi:hypothetical protein
MTTFKTTSGPICRKCQRPMAWVSEQVVESKPMQVFQCEVCDKYAAALPGTNDVPASVRHASSPASRQ